MNLIPSFLDGKNKARIHHNDSKSVEFLATELISNFPIITGRPIVIVCIGTDRSTGDSLGPLVGTLLEEKNLESFHVYGTLDNPIHAVNLSEKLKEIKEKHFHPFIIAIDACLGRLKNVGVIEIGEGPLKPGAGVNKELPNVGNIHITGIVNVSGFMEFFVLQNTRLNLVLKMAKTIANSIYLANITYKKNSELPKYNWEVEKIE